MENYQITHGFKKPESKRVERVLKNIDDKIVENPKKCLILYGVKTSGVIKEILREFVNYIK
jgi:hypothetical protein